VMSSRTWKKCRFFPSSRRFLGIIVQHLSGEVFDIAVQQNKKHSSFRLVAVITAPLPVVVVTREHGSTDLLPGLATQFMEYQTAGQGQSYF
jgi:hypothetical protein